MVTGNISSPFSVMEYTSFDILGRVLAAKQTTDGTAYSTGYIYNLSGALIEETYPSGRVVKNTLDEDGSLSQVHSKKTAGDILRPYATNFTYNAAGAVTQMRLGNGRWESTQFNSRLQPVQIGLGSGPTAQNLLKLDYEYGATAAVNNGNVTKQTITVPTVGANTGFTAVQSYTYDEVNRLKDAVENVTPTGGSASQSWRQAFTFDRYGNRNFDEANSTTLPKNCGTAPNLVVCEADRKVVNPSADAANNRFSAGQGYVYDAAGNTIADANGQTYFYDAENKMVTASNASGTLGQYTYDGDGKRIKKFVPSTGETTVFAYDASGKMVAEYSTNVEPVATAKVNYLTTDHLGSPRINTDATGNVTARHDYHPFGEEIATSQRTVGLGYAADTVRKQFTGYERDNEVGLDFAQARYYSSKLGRFYSVDPESAGAIEDYPQSWNAYAYVGNNPLNFTDPDGEKWKVCDNQRNCIEISDAEANRTLFNRKNVAPEIRREKGKIYDEDGSLAGTYTRISFDDLSDTANAMIFGPNSIGEQGIKKGKLVEALAGGAVVVGACIGSGVCPAAAAAAAPFLLRSAGKALSYSAKITR
ncbi:MAG: hypothetical protein DYH05_08735 [Acidobacteria bacterium ACB1]|nr:hypothetical protein [Pyrinomonadaceae bacterium]MCE7962567.1 hypothetical protein [Acidobacteria bacterium ACB1]RIJ94207.1 MAG: hypothetical protein DCC44_05065 [Acidobacteriota bacterium]